MVVPRQNLFLIVFETEEGPETVMEGRPWLFRKQLILFDRLVKPKILNGNCGSPLNMRIWRLSTLDVDEWGMGSKIEEGPVMEHIERLNGIDSMLEDKSKSVKKTSWKRIRPVVMMNQDEEESVMRKRQK
ncbi:hypothetical protein Goklo_016545 [Gossypium klotzschianum]|uniref:DUF4283 domain-containing protein n=1 Tax=Gossypium klotzschianum TaxID=34286 RepID=A0A7J8UEK6_9ROSI|nr:hypothetical protein [Gossypium klotzschianum]